MRHPQLETARPHFRLAGLEMTLDLPSLRCRRKLWLKVKTAHVFPNFHHFHCLLLAVSRKMEKSSSSRQEIWNSSPLMLGLPFLFPLGLGKVKVIPMRGEERVSISMKNALAQM